MIVSHYYLSTENATSDEVSGSVWELLLLFSFFSFCLFFVCLFVFYLAEITVILDISVV